MGIKFLVALLFVFVFLNAQSKQTSVENSLSDENAKKSLEAKVKKVPKNKKLTQKRSSQVLTTKKDYESAKALFTQKRYQEAYDAFYKLFQNDLKNPNINFFLGRSAFELGMYDLAIASYERIININEKAYRVKLEIARSYRRMKDPKKAKEIFNELRPHVPANVQRNIDRYLAQMESDRKKHSLTGAAIVGLNYDTNVFGVTVENALSDKIQGFTLNNAAAKSWAHQEVIAANYAYAIDEKYILKVDSLLFNKTIFDYHKMDLKLIQIAPALSVAYSDKLVVDYGVYANTIWLGPVKRLMSNYALNPKLSYIQSDELLINGALKYQSQKNYAPNPHRDNDLYSFELGATYVYNKDVKLNAISKYERVREKQPFQANDNNEVAYNQYDVTFGCQYTYNPKIVIAPKIKMYQKDYVDTPIPSLSGKKRNDEEFQYALTGTYIYSPEVILTLEYIHFRHDSNYVDNKFIKDSLSFNVILPFSDTSLKSIYKNFRDKL